MFLRDYLNYQNIVVHAAWKIVLGVLWLKRQKNTYTKHNFLVLLHMLTLLGWE